MLALSSKEYFKKNKEEIDSHNLRYLRNLSAIGILFFIVFSVYFGITRINDELLNKYLISLVTFIVFFFFAFLYRKKAKYNHSLIEFVVMLFMLYSLAFGAAVGMPNKQAYAVMLPMFIITLSTAFISNWYKHFFINVLVSGVYIYGVIFIVGKDLNIVFTDAQNIVAAIVLGIVLQILSQNLRVKDFNSKVALQRISAIDELTNLPNRRMFNQHLDELFSGKVGKPFSALMFDVDNFKSINDTYGHLAGDEVLKAIGSIINDILSLNNEIFAARYGGEEFILVSTSMTSEQMCEVAKGVQNRLGMFKIPLINFKRVTISGGVSSIKSTLRDNTNMVVDEADRALYMSKAQGKNRITLFKNIK